MTGDLSAAGARYCVYATRSHHQDTYQVHLTGHYPHSIARVCNFPAMKVAAQHGRHAAACQTACAHPHLLLFSLMTALLRSAPMMIRSLAYSRLHRDQAQGGTRRLSTGQESPNCPVGTRFGGKGPSTESQCMLSPANPAIRPTCASRQPSAPGALHAGRPH
jgi:hypothetical protein